MPLIQPDYERYPQERPMVDFDSLVYTLLTAGFTGNPDWPDVHVLNEIDVDVDTWASFSNIVLFHTNAPTMATGNHSTGVWDCDIDIIVATNDADRSFCLAQEVYQQIMQWPRYGRTDSGRVIRIVGNPGFGKSAGGKQATGKKVKQYSASSFTVRAEDSLRVG
jgi:hypothetical protein